MQNITDRQLIQELKGLLANEHKTLAAFLAHLAEVDRRRLHEELGFSSLFRYCVAELHLSEDAVYKRIRVARAARNFPIIMDLIAEGRIHLTAVTLLAPLLTEENHQELLEKACCKTKVEVERLCAAYSPKPDVADSVRKLPSQITTDCGTSSDLGATDLGTLFNHRQDDPETSSEPDAAPELVTTTTPARRDCLAPLSEERFKVQFTGSAELLEKIERVKQVLRHKFPKCRLEDVFDAALEALLDKKDPARRIARSEKRKARDCDRARKETRSIPQVIRNTVWKRDQGQCQYVSPEGVQCCEAGGLEYDHITPWALEGSSNDPDNIRLLCLTHNKMAARKVFGERWINKCIQSKPRGISIGRARACNRRSL